MRLAFFALAALTGTACYIDLRPHAARSRGALMLECPADQVAVRSIGAARYEVQGCGKEAIVACDNVSNGNGGGMQSVSCHREEVAMDIPSHPAAVQSMASKKIVDDHAPGTPFDKAAVKMALSSIDYSDCGVTGNAKIALTFDASGAVEEVVVVEGELDAKATACLKQRFGSVKIPPSPAGGDDKHEFGWQIGADDAPSSEGAPKTAAPKPAAPKPAPKNAAPKAGEPKPIAM